MASSRLYKIAHPGTTAAFRTKDASQDETDNVAELGSLAAAFAIKPGIRVGGRGMRLVTALLVVDILLAVAPGRRLLVCLALGVVTLGSGPGFHRVPHRNHYRGDHGPEGSGQVQGVQEVVTINPIPFVEDRSD